MGASYRGDRINIARQSYFFDFDITRVSRSDVESAVGYLADARLPRPRQMAPADCQQYKRRLRGLAVDAEHRPQRPSGWGM